jgi:hypothetical protein
LVELPVYIGVFLAYTKYCIEKKHRHNMANPQANQTGLKQDPPEYNIQFLTDGRLTV